ncbi:hypothetical protein KAI56_00200 [Candidatus Parcubacteria bacterium]|nr:hypothetical protein [Candidatus Parcubacteria bacterium]
MGFFLFDKDFRSDRVKKKEAIKLPINESPKEIMETATNKLVATHKITVRTKISSDCSEEKIKELLLNWEKASLELLQIENGKIEIILFYTSDISNIMRIGVIKVEPEEEVLEGAYFYFQKYIPSTCIKIEKEDIKVERALFPEEKNQFLVLF